MWSTFKKKMANNLFSISRMFCETHFDSIHNILCEYQIIQKKVTLLLETLKVTDGINIDSIYKKTINTINKSYGNVDSLINDLNKLKELIKSYEQ